MEIVNRLIAIQQSLGMSEREFAKKLGISHGLWNQTKNGKARVNDTLLRGAMQAFPDLEEDVIKYRLAQLRQSDRTVAAVG